MGYVLALKSDNPEYISTSMESSINKNDITWTFDTTYEVGQFVTGDYFVIDPGSGVTITGISPASTDVSGRIANGSMINPDPDIYNTSGGAYDAQAQGYDNAMWISDHHYYNDLNVAYDVDAENPLVVNNGDSLISTKSNATPNNRPQLESAEILTVLSSVPLENSFRPAYALGSKTIYIWDDTALSNLQSLSTSGISGIPSIETVSDWFAHPWMDHVPGYLGEYIHPTDNMPSYGANVASRIGNAALWLNLDFSSVNKEDLAIGLIQCGIDFYGIICNGYEENGSILQWWASGGQCAGRKFPTLFAGIMLNNQDMLNKVVDSDVVYAEDGQTFYVTQESVDFEGYSATACGHNEENLPCGGYTEGMIGMPDWGITHAVNWYRDTALWETQYRDVTMPYWFGFVLATIAMDAVSDWGHNAIFDYADRHIQYETEYGTGPLFETQWVEDVWLAHRSNLTSEWPYTDWGDYNDLVSEV